MHQFETPDQTSIDFALMLFMVIETFKGGNAKAVAERFSRSGRMLPDGVNYHASWIEPTGARCFQVMEAATPDLFNAWIDRWCDLVDFEVIPVLNSVDFWAKTRLEQTGAPPTPRT